MVAVRRIMERIFNALRAVGFMQKKDGIEKVVDMLTSTARSMRKESEMVDTVRGGLPLFRRTDATREAYEKRIDELFAGAAGKSVGIKMLDDSDILSITGYGNMPVLLKEFHAVDDGKYNHGMTADQWKQVPDWLENPVAVFERKSDGHLTVIAPVKIKGKAVIIAVEPKTGAPSSNRESTRHLVLTAYPKDRGVLNLKSAVERSEYAPVYVDQKKNSPEFYSGSGISFPGRTAELRAARKNVKTERDLVKYRLSQSANEKPESDNLRDPSMPPDSLDGALFRRAVEGDGSAVDALKQHMQDRFAKDLKTFGWWHKSVGTQYHKAW